MSKLLPLGQQPSAMKGRCMVTFHAHPFTSGTGKQEAGLFWATEAPDGNFQKIIDDAREAGGFWLEQGKTLVFLPWPPAAIEVNPFA